MFYTAKNRIIVVVRLSETAKKKLKELGVGTVYLFGSRATDTALENSDYDIGIVFLNVKQVYENDINLFTALYEILINDFPERIGGSTKDI